MKNTSISILGTIAVDTIETKSKKETNIGGSATFAAIAASFLSKPGIVSVIGNDTAIETFQILNNYNVDTSGIKKEPGPTFQWAARYDENMDCRSSILTDIGVFENFKPFVPDFYRSSDCLVIGAVDPEIQLSFISQFECPKLIIGDTIGYYIERASEKVLSFFASCQIVVINEEEARNISCEATADKAAKSILSSGPIIVILKQGKNGATLYYNSQKMTIPAFYIENCIDPTGAGDTFLGAFSSYLANSLPLTKSDIIDAIIYANCISSFAIQDFGLKHLAAVEREEVHRRCKSISSKSNLPIPKLNPEFLLDKEKVNCTAPPQKK